MKLSWLCELGAVVALGAVFACSSSSSAGVAGSAGNDASAGAGGADAGGGAAGIAGNGGIGGHNRADASAEAGGAAGVAGSSGAAGQGGAGGVGGAGGSGPPGCFAACPTCGTYEDCTTVAGTTCKVCRAISVSVPAPDGGTYGIDATEVTFSQYTAWYNTEPSVAALPSYCVTNADAGPDAGTWKVGYHPGTGSGTNPVTDVDWCDAYVYCQAVGKRLCGRLGGGASDFTAEWDTVQDQWHNACASGGVNVYPYSSDAGAYQPDTCNGLDYWGDQDAGSSAAALPVATLAGCQPSVTGFTGVYDLSGNVMEWEDSCNGMGGEDDYCHLRGGAFNQRAGVLACGHGLTTHRSAGGGNIGVRCCSSP